MADKKKKHKVKGMRVRKATTGGYIAHHDEMMPGEDGTMPPQEEHVLPDLAALKDHMNHFEPQEEEEMPSK